LFGFEAVVIHWAWVVLLAGTTFLGVMLVFGRPSASDHVEMNRKEKQRRLELGMFLFALVAGVLVFAPTVVFGMIFGPVAVMAHWAAVVVLAALSFTGMYLIFTAKRRTRRLP